MITCRRWLFLAAASGALAAGQAQAQTQSPTASETMAVEAVIVTAQKRAQNVQDVPISLEVVEGQTIEALQVNNFDTLRNYVPNLQVQPSPGNYGVFIRGFGSGPQNNGFDQSVSLYVDGVYGGRIRQFMAPLFDIERVEVLRGPQGALFGKNTAAGAISIVTAGPTSTFQGQATGSYNFSRNGGELSGFISGPINDALSARLAVKYTDLGGYIENTATGTDDPSVVNLSARASLRFAPNDRFDVTAKLSFDDLSTRGKSGMQVSAANPVLRRTKASASPFGVREADDQSSYNASVTANLTIGEHVLTSVTGYSAFEDRVFAGGASGSPEDWLGTFRDSFEQWSQEIRLTSPEGRRFDYIVGAYWDTHDFAHYNASRYNLFGGTLNGQTHIDFAQDSTTWSVFGQGTFRITEALRLLGSLRWSDTEKDGQFRQSLDFGIPIATPRAFADSLDEETVDASATVQFDVAPRVMLYATYGEGSKAGGFVTNTRTITASQFKFGPESSKNYEAGLKSTLWDGRMLFNLTVFKTTFDDLQVAQFDPAATAFIIRNAASATSKGAEALLRVSPADGLNLSASVAYLDAKYDKFPNGNCLSTGAVPPPATCVQDLSGTVLPGASKWSGTFSADYSRPIASNLKLSLFGVVSFRSRYFTATDESPTYGVEDGWTKLDARIEVGDLADRWAVALVGRNITNTLSQSFSYLWTLSNPPVGVQFLDETRSISLEGRVRF